MMRINSHRMPCFRVTYPNRVKKIVKAPDMEAVRHFIRRPVKVTVIKHSTRMDVDSGAHVAVDWQGRVLRMAQHVDREEF